MKSIINKIILILIFFSVLYLFIKGYLYKSEINQNRRETICQFVYCKKYPKTTESTFRYYINNNLYKNTYGQCPDNSEQKLYKFFVLYYSSKDPNKIQVDFSKEITDEKMISDAGFSKDDITH